MNVRRLALRLMAPDGGDGGQGGGAPASAPAAAPASGAPAAPAAPATPPAEPSLLSLGKDAPITPAGDPSAPGADPKLKDDPLAWLPEKYRVKAEDGTVKIEDSAKKLSQAYGELNKRMVDTGLPPDSADKYTFTPPKGMEKLELDADLTAQAKKGLHGLGLTQKQYQGVMEMYVGSLNNVVERGTELGAAKATEELAKTWGPADGAQFKTNLGLAFKAFNAFADEGDKAAMDQIGNNPATLRLLAKIGRELREDTSTAGEILSPESVETLMKDPAYMNPQHPRHAEVKTKVARHFEAQAAAQARASGA